MKWRSVAMLGVGGLVVAAGATAAWISTLPESVGATAVPAVAMGEQEATLAALRPPRESRPLIAIIGLNAGTETTDYILPYGVLRRADVAEVVALSAKPGIVKLFPALQVAADMSSSAFDVQYRDGADYVIVPAMSRDDDPEVLSWLQSQAKKGAIVVGICAGAKVMAAAGLLDGKRATTHWYYRKSLFEKYPSADFIRDRRIVTDARVATTTGISASIPMMLTLIEAIAGRGKAEAIGADLGVEQWDLGHASDAFLLTRGFAQTVLGNSLAVWKRERFRIELRPGVDEVSLALVADAWSRTYRSRAFTIAPTATPVETRNGLRVIPDRTTPSWPSEQPLIWREDLRPTDALEQALNAIASRYGTATAEVVARQLEYPGWKRGGD